MSIDAVTQSQLLLAQGFSGIADVLQNAPIMQTSTRDVITTLNVPAAVNGIQVYGGSSISDGQIGIFARVTASSALTITSADGAFWELTTPTFLNINVAGTASIANITFGTAGLTLSTLAVSGGITCASLDCTGTITAAALVSGSDLLMTTSAELTFGGGAQTGTLNTAPTSGDPSKWIGINDNGQMRWIPSWES